MAGEPGVGRVAMHMIAPRLLDHLDDWKRQAARMGQKIDCTTILNTVGGTSRAGAEVSGMLQHAALPSATRRALVVLPLLEGEIHVHERKARSLNSFTAGCLLHEGMTMGGRRCPTRSGLVEVPEARLYDELILVCPEFQTDERASVQGLSTLAELEALTARIAAGYVGQSPAYRGLMDRLYDATEHRWANVGTPEAPRVRAFSAVNESRTRFDRERLRLRVDRVVLG